MTIRSYSFPAAFKEALEQRLKSGLQSGVNLQRNRQLVMYVESKDMDLGACVKRLVGPGRRQLMKQ